MGRRGGALRGIARDLRTLLRVYRGDLSALESGEGGAGDLIVVLGAQVRAGGRPSRALTARARHAGGMYFRGWTGPFVVSGGVGEHPPSEAEIMASVLREQGVTEDLILREAASSSTRHSAHHVTVLARQLGATGAVLVTDPLHCVRAASAFRAEGLRVRSEPATGSPMWREPRERLGQLLRESGAVVWYGLRQGTG